MTALRDLVETALVKQKIYYLYIYAHVYMYVNQKLYRDE